MGFLPSWLNPYDFLIALVLVGGAALGFVRGLVRMALSLVVLYVAAALAMVLYPRVGTWIHSMSGLPLAVAQGLAFLLILAVVAILLNFLLHRTYKETELPGLRQVDQLGGMVIGFFLTAIWIGLALLVLAYVLSAPVTDNDSFRVNMIGYFQSSALIPIFYKFLPIALATLRPWMPKGVPPEIFTFRL
jgi:membrane protein required for colicin V production